MKTKKIALLGILSAQAIALSALEGMIPPMPFVPPGAKPGFSNIVTMFASSALGLKEALLVTLLKALFAGVTRGFSAMLMSAAGGFLSALAMWFLFKIKKNPFGIIGISLIAATLHNAGQLAAAMLLAGSVSVVSYAPALLAFSLVTGTVTGIVLKAVMPALRRQMKFFIDSGFD